MSTSTTRLTGTLERFLPLIVLVIILLFAYFWFIQPRVTSYLASRGEVSSLEARLQGQQNAIRQGRSEPPTDSAAIMRQFEALMSPDDKVADVVEILLRTATASAPNDQFRSLQVQTGEPVRSASGDRGPRVAGSARAESDPRYQLFPVSIVRTPVTIAFESSFEGIAGFVWRIRDMPTLVEIRSLELTRGLPLMKASVTLFVYQRGPSVPDGPPASDEQPAPPAVPRVAMLTSAR